MRFSLPSIKFSAAPPSFPLLPNAVRVIRLFTVVRQFKRTPIAWKFEVDYCNIDLFIRFNNPLYKRRIKLYPLSKYAWHYTSGTWEFDRFPRTVFQRLSDFKIFLFFSLYQQLFETNQNTEKTLSILMGLKGGDCVRKAEVKANNVRIRCNWEQFL